MTKKRSRKHKDFDDATGVTDEEVKAEFKPSTVNYDKETEEEKEAEVQAEASMESNAVARKMLVDAPAHRAEKNRVATLDAKSTKQRKLSTEERLDQLEKAAGLSPVVME